MAHIRQSRPGSGLGSGLGFQVKVVEIFEVVPSSLGSETRNQDRESFLQVLSVLGMTHVLKVEYLYTLSPNP